MKIEAHYLTDYEGDRLLKLGEVVSIVSLGRTTLYALIKEGKFPIPVQAGPGAVRWRKSEIDAWIAALPHARGERDAT